MKPRARKTRHRRAAWRRCAVEPRRPVRGRGPAWTVAVLAFALLSQTGLSLLHALSHERGNAAITSRAANARVGEAHNAPDQASAAGVPVPHVPGPTDEHRHGPAWPAKGCELCGLIGVAKLGWAVAPAPAVVAAGPAPVLERALPAARKVATRPTSAAPRGPPVNA